MDGWNGNVFVEPYITVDKAGHVWVSDPTANRIFVFDQNGKRLKTITTDYKGRVFQRPMGLAEDANGNILVVDTHHHRITRIPPLE